MAFVICGSLLFQCKKKCESEKIGTLSFTSAELKILPYNGTDLLVFKDSLGDSIYYNGDTRSSRYDNSYYEHPSDQECKGNYYYYEGNYSLFKGKDNYHTVQIDLNFSSPYQFPTKYRIINFRILYKKTTNMEFNGVFAFDTTSIMGVPIGFSNPYKSSLIAFHDNITILGHVFYNVYELTANTSIRKLYFSKNNGVVGFKTDDNKSWYLKQ